MYCAERQEWQYFGLVSGLGNWNVCIGPVYSDCKEGLNDKPNMDGKVGGRGRRQDYWPLTVHFWNPLLLTRICFDSNRSMFGVIPDRGKYIFAAILTGFGVHLPIWIINCRQTLERRNVYVVSCATRTDADCANFAFPTPIWPTGTHSTEWSIWISLWKGAHQNGRNRMTLLANSLSLVKFYNSKPLHFHSDCTKSNW